MPDCVWESTCSDISSTGTEIASVQPADSRWQCGVPLAGSTAVKGGVVLKGQSIEIHLLLGWNGMVMNCTLGAVELNSALNCRCKWNTPPERKYYTCPLGR